MPEQVFEPCENARGGFCRNEVHACMDAHAVEDVQDVDVVGSLEA